METLRKKAADRLLRGGGKGGGGGAGPESSILIVPGPLTRWEMDPSAEPKLVQLMPKGPHSISSPTPASTNS